MGPNVIFAIGAFLIFGILLSSSNQLMSVNMQIADQNEYYITAVSLGQSVIEEAKGKNFDEKTVGRSASLLIPDSLSVVLGPDNASEQSVPCPDTAVTTAPYSSSSPGFLSSVKFNDVDDYNGYQRIVNTQRTEGYLITSRVYYASPTYPDSTLTTVSFCKKMIVTVKSPYIPDSITVYYVFTY